IIPPHTRQKPRPTSRQTEGANMQLVMKRAIVAVAFVGAAAAGTAAQQAAPQGAGGQGAGGGRGRGPAGPPFSIGSPALTDLQMLPAKYGCAATPVNVSPPIS